IEHRLKLGGRGSDDAENFTGRGLLLKCLCEVTVPLLQLLKQPYIFNRDDGLVCEGCDQLDLLFCEGPDFGLSNQDYAYDAAFPEHGDSQDRSGTAQPISGPLIFRIRENVGDVNHPVLKCDSRNSASSPWANRISLNEIFPLLRHIISDGRPQQLAVHPQNEPRIGTAQSCSV